MACAQPFSIPNPHYLEYGFYKSYLKYIEVPCGWCLNCRVDKQNWLTDACYYEQKNMTIFVLLLHLLMMIFIY